MTDPYNLNRFLDAQGRVFDTVLAELRQGNKRSHWMWFIFPQISGLGHSDIAKRFAITSLEEAVAYLDHPVLAARLRECTHLVTAVEGRTIRQILGPPDDMKFRSCMTLFARATSDNAVFVDALQKYFAGESDQMTINRLSDAGSS